MTYTSNDYFVTSCATSVSIGGIETILLKNLSSMTVSGRCFDGALVSYNTTADFIVIGY